jgi:putative peptidoglycan lipid II flippase
MTSLIRSVKTRLVDKRSSALRSSLYLSLLGIVGLTCFAKGTIAFKDLAVAHIYGVDGRLDAFLIAYLVPFFLTSLISGSFTASFIPTYVQVKAHGGEGEALDLISGLIYWGTITLLVLTVLLVGVMPLAFPLFQTGFTPAQLALTRGLFLIVLPIVVLTGYRAILSAVLNAEEKYARATLSTSIAPVVTAVFVLALSRPFGIYALAYGTLLGAFVELLILMAGMREKSIACFFRGKRDSRHLKTVLQQLLPMIAGAFLLGSTTMIDQLIAATAGPGSVSALDYGGKIVLLIAGVSATAIGTIVLPYFSRLVVNGDKAGIRHAFTTYGAVILAFTVPMTAAFMWGSEALVRFVFERGAFTAGDTKVVAAIQRYYVLQLPFFVLGNLFVRFISSLKANHLLMWGAVISLVLNIVLDFMLLNWMGIPGIALSTSIVYMISFFYLSFMSLRLYRRLPYHGQG